MSNNDLNLTVYIYRNYDIEVETVAGFVIPTTKDKCPLLKVSLSWNEDEVKFQSMSDLVGSKEDLIAQIELCAKQHQSMIERFDSSNFKGLFLPIDTKRFFGESSVQIPAGQSIVVAAKEY